MDLDYGESGFETTLLPSIDADGKPLNRIALDALERKGRFYLKVNYVMSYYKQEQVGAYIRSCLAALDKLD